MKVNSGCTISFFKNDLQRTRLKRGLCPIRDCSADLSKVPFRKYSLPFCYEHGIRIHKKTFVYYNGTSKEEKELSIRRNLIFHSNYYLNNIFKKGSKAESTRLCYENSEDAVSYNIFTELLDKNRLSKLVRLITGKQVDGEVELYLWGGKIDLENNCFSIYEPLEKVREELEGDKRHQTEPDIMLVIPKRLIICIEAKFGSKNSSIEDKESKDKEKKGEMIERYCRRNRIIKTDKILDLDKIQESFYTQLFRNIVFACSMAELEGKIEWYVVNLRNQHLLNLKKNRPASLPVVKNIRSYLKPRFKKTFKHLTWEDIYEQVVKGNPELADLTWYMKNKSLSCGRAFNIK